MSSSAQVISFVMKDQGLIPDALLNKTHFYFVLMLLEL
jgi:hypothetical protein